jgi:hypothetical protein
LPRPTQTARWPAHTPETDGKTGSKESNNEAGPPGDFSGWTLVGPAQLGDWICESTTKSFKVGSRLADWVV